MNKDLTECAERITNTFKALSEILVDDCHETKQLLFQLKKDIQTLFHSQVRTETAVIKLHRRLKKLEAKINGKEEVEKD